LRFPVWASWIAPVFLLLSGCYFITKQDPYPEDWVPLRGEDGFYSSSCPDLTGTYNAWARVSGQSSGPPAPWGLARYDGQGVTHFAIKGPIDGRLEISAWLGDRKVRDNVVTSPADFTCYQGRLDVTSTAGRSTLHHVYARARDGALVEEMSSVEVMFVLITVIETRRSWTRWRIKD